MYDVRRGRVFTEQFTAGTEFAPHLAPADASQTKKTSTRRKARRRLVQATTTVYELQYVPANCNKVRVNMTSCVGRAGTAEHKKHARGVEGRRRRNTSAIASTTSRRLRRKGAHRTLNVHSDLETELTRQSHVAAYSSEHRGRLGKVLRTLTTALSAAGFFGNVAVGLPVAEQN